MSAQEEYNAGLYTEIKEAYRMARRGIRKLKQRYFPSPTLYTYPEPVGDAGHYKWFLDSWAGLIRAEEKAQREKIPLGYPVLVQQYLDDAWLTGSVDGITTRFGLSGLVADGHHSSWDGVIDANDVVVDDDTVPMTITEFHRYDDPGLVEVSSAPAAASTITANYYTECIGELASVQAVDNGKTIDMYPHYNDSVNPSLGAYMVCVFGVPEVKANTQIKGYLRMAATATCDSVFQQKAYDFTAGAWTEMQADPNLTFSPDSADTSFQIYTFTADHADFVSDDNLMAIAWRGRESVGIEHVGFYLDYAWAWLDRKSGWF